MKRPNFFIAGVTKGGTTSLYKYLRQHPQVFLASVKEPRFFAFMEEDTRATPFSTEAMYLSLFAKVPDACVAVGEASAMYFHCPRALERISWFAPCAKLLIVLRDPIDRAYSHFNFMRREGREKRKGASGFTQALQEGSCDPRSHARVYYERSLYSKPLEQCMELFDPGQVLTLRHEELQLSPEETLQRICRFLRVTESWHFETGRRHNETRLPHGRSYSFASRALNSAAHVLQPILVHVPGAVLRDHLNPLAQRLLHGLRSKGERPEPLPPDVRSQLLPLFVDDIYATERLTKFDLSTWRT